MGKRFKATNIISGKIPTMIKFPAIIRRRLEAESKLLHDAPINGIVINMVEDTLNQLDKKRIVK
jgi:hypothetical protein